MQNNYINPTPSGTGFTDPNAALQHTKLNNSHEQTILKEKNRHEHDLLDKKNKHEKDIKNKELGWVGFVFGGRDLTALNISGLLIIMLVVIGVIFTFKIICCPKDSQSITVLELWGIFTPLITLTLGYLFGNKNNK